MHYLKPIKYDYEVTFRKINLVDIISTPKKNNLVGIIHDHCLIIYTRYFYLSPMEMTIHVTYSFYLPLTLSPWQYTFTQVV